MISENIMFGIGTIGILAMTGIFIWWQRGVIKEIKEGCAND